ncbi:hypothetical protein BOX15_Mlig030206g2 [Macrostomum lignano]|uniref:ZZ-type domain-containing protein n=1 Tax=Macrostomum lignano TaxID=282301 RepID=A0A267EJH8_9PLAT|nr:hypothetical protein BOX15_Mlig030206g2 [Macrostomum lignano]
MNSEIPFKVYYEDEIRRFSLPETVCNDGRGYACLVQRIQSVFDISPNKPLRLRWLDLEGDRIVFSSSPELADAVGQLTLSNSGPGAAVRVYVSLVGSPDTFDQNAIVHPGVYCDGCNSGIRGYRFKCLVCPDFDLCRDCLNKDSHNQHQMKLIRRPGDGGWGGGFAGGWGGGWQHPGMRRCFQRHHRGQLAVAESHASGNTDDNAGSGQRRGGRGCAMRDAAAMATVATELVSSGASTPPLATSAASVCTEQQLLVEHVTSAISTALQPMGIDASIQVMRQESDAGVQASTARTPSSDATIKTSSSASAESSAGPRGPVLAQSNFCTPSQPPPPPPPPHSESGAAFGSVPMEATSASFVGGGTTGGNCSDGGFELLAALDPKIARSLEHMTAMGFNDDGGWLTRLLTSKDGDICAVLDAIRPLNGGGK